jgi:hypothetical protein
LRDNGKILWTYDFILVKKDGSIDTQRGRFKDNDQALWYANVLLNKNQSVKECQVYSIVRKSKMLVDTLKEPKDISYRDVFGPVEVWEPVREVKKEGWTIKWEGSKEALENNHTFVLLDEDRDIVVYIRFEGDSFVIESPYSGLVRVDALNPTITILDEEEKYEEE